MTNEVNRTWFRLLLLWMKMTTYLQEMINKGCKDLQAVPNKMNYNKPADATLSRMILFNKVTRLAYYRKMQHSSSS